MRRSPSDRLALFAVLGLVTLAGCASRDPIEDVRFGMPKAQVRALLGAPHNQYENLAIECWFWERTRDTAAMVCFSGCDKVSGIRPPSGEPTMPKGYPGHSPWGDPDDAFKC